MTFRVLLVLALTITTCNSQTVRIGASAFADVVPLIIGGGEWTTQIVFTNFSAASVTIPVLFYGQDGKPLNLPLVGMVATSQLQVTVVAQGTVILQTQPAANALVGWALADFPCTSENCGSIIGQAVLRNRAAGRPDYEAVFPFSDELTRELILPYDHTNGFDTTLILTNAENYSFSKPMVVTAAFFDDSGNRIVLDQITIPVAGNTFFSLSQKYPQLVGKKGYVDMSTTNGDLVSGGLRINPTNAFAAILAFEP